MPLQERDTLLCMAAKASMDGGVFWHILVPGVLSADGTLMGRGGHGLPSHGWRQPDSRFLLKSGQGFRRNRTSLGERNALLMAPLSKVLLRYF